MFLSLSCLSPYHSPQESLTHLLSLPPSTPTTSRCLCTPLDHTSNFPQVSWPLQASLPRLCPCPSAEVHNQSASIQPGPVLASLETNVWQVYSHVWQEPSVETCPQQASCAMLLSFCVLNTQVQAYVCQSCLLQMSAVGMQEHTWSWMAIFCAQAESVFNHLAGDSLTLYTCDHVIKDFLLLSQVTPLLVCAPTCPKSRQTPVY